MRLKFNLKKFYDFWKAYLIDKTLRSREEWSRDKLEKFQREQLNKLLRYALANSPFYKDLYKDVEIDSQISLTDLPVTSKEMMMENFDLFLTDRRLKLSQIETHIENLSRDEYYLDDFHVLTTGGSSGLKGIFIFNREEWCTAIASALRWNRFMGVSPGFPIRTKISSIGAGSPLHATYRVATSAIGPYNLQILDATDSIEKLVTSLNDFKPDVLNSYPSIASILALEQVDGNLNISPNVVCTVSEVRTEDMERNIKEAWHTQPFDYYGMTEVMSVGSDCSYHHGIHVFEDLQILEVVDENEEPVPDGSSGHKILVTNLYNFTQPIIRYEVSDMIKMSTEECPCGRPFRLIEEMQGRNDDIMYLPGEEKDKIAVHPMHFRGAVAEFQEIKKYQFIRKENGIHIRLEIKDGASSEEIGRDLEEKIEENLESLGVSRPHMHFHFEESIKQNPQNMGKHKLIKTELDDAEL